MSKHSRNLLLLLALALLAFAHLPESGEEPTMNDFELIDTHWWVEDIDGKGVIDASHTTIAFLEDQQAAGDSGCNRWFGPYTLEGSQLEFGIMAGTRRACAESLMNQETRFYQALGRVVSWEVPKATGLLHLKDAAGNTMIRAWRIEEGEA